LSAFWQQLAEKCRRENKKYIIILKRMGKRSEVMNFLKPYCHTWLEQGNSKNNANNQSGSVQSFYGRTRGFTPFPNEAIMYIPMDPIVQYHKIQKELDACDEKPTSDCPYVINMTLDFLEKLTLMTSKWINTLAGGDEHRAVYVNTRPLKYKLRRGKFPKFATAKEALLFLQTEHKNNNLIICKRIKKISTPVTSTSIKNILKELSQLKTSITSVNNTTTGGDYSEDTIQTTYEQGTNLNRRYHKDSLPMNELRAHLFQGSNTIYSMTTIRELAKPTTSVVNPSLHTNTEAMDLALV
jgi:hypothetical protein